MASKRHAAQSAAAAAAAVAVAGAAAACARLVHGRRAFARAADRSYRLRRDELVPDGIRRIARAQLEGAHEQLDGASERRLGEAVHETRKHLKRLRAVLRLTRDAIGERTYERENSAFGTAGRRLSEGRDAAVLVQTLEALCERFSGELAPTAATRLREQLERDHQRSLTAMTRDGADVRAALAEIDEARLRVPAWSFASDGFDALGPGMRRIYRRGRKRMRTACASPTTENLHEARKRVKDLWYAAQIMERAAPKRTKELAADAHGVAELLGDDHDLAVLREYVDRHARGFEDDGQRLALLGVIDRRRHELQRKALKRGRRLYERSPQRFVAKIERGWSKRAGERAQPKRARKRRTGWVRRASAVRRPWAALAARRR